MSISMWWCWGIIRNRCSRLLEVQRLVLIELALLLVPVELVLLLVFKVAQLLVLLPFSKLDDP